jgi:acetyltransferase-like isoleucine patch superfamily enzyme
MSGAADVFEIHDDWYRGVVPRNILVEKFGHVETSRSFLRFHSQQQPGLIVQAGACLYNPTLDVGPQGRIVIGEHALVSSAAIFCDCEVTVGAMAMLAWGVVVMDSYRGWSPENAGPAVRDGWCVGPAEARPVHIGSNVWLGFESCILPGVTIGDGSVVGARAVVFDDVPANCIVAGNPARVVRRFSQAEQVSSRQT